MAYVELIDRLNQSLKTRFQRPTYYRSVAALCIYWKECTNDGFKREAEELGTLFADSFKYDVSYYQIPSERSQHRLSRRIWDYLNDHLEKETLLIIHYGGHGDENTQHGEERESVWCSEASRKSPFLKWTEIQRTLSQFDSEILVLLDCCFASQAARAESPIPSNVELLAACGLRMKTNLPGPTSFTSIFMKELRLCLSQNKPAKISDVFRNMSAKEANLFQSAIHFSLGGRLGSICLEPFKPQMTPIKSSPPESSLLFRLSMREKLEEDCLQEIIEWFKINPPKAISNVEVQHIAESTRAARDFIEDNDIEGRSSVRVTTLPLPAQNDLYTSWGNFSRHIERLASVLRFGSSSNSPVFRNIVPKDHKLSDYCVEQLKSSFRPLQSSIETNVMSSPELSSPSNLQNAMEDQTITGMGLKDTLELRLIAQNTPNQPQDPSLVLNMEPEYCPKIKIFQTVTVSTLPEVGKVIIEAREYGFDQSTEDRILKLSQSHMEKIAKLLRTRKSSDFHTLECIRYFHEAKQRRYGLLFAIPPRYATSEIFSLRKIISHPLKENERPSLGQRFQIAAKIGRALLKWHLVGQVHQGIASHNVFFFRNSDKVIDYANPYLCGFEYSRESDAPSSLAIVEDFELNIYRHPTRQGTPSKSHQKEHDIYAFGILLLELGMWKLAESHFAKGEKDFIKAPDMSERLIQTSKKKLGHYIGLPYQQAANTCLKGDFGVSSDDKVQSQLARSFEELVIKPLDIGLVLSSEDTRQ